ncbi:hypothetical protein [Methylomarinum vadi]|uniref:hypothetical protein n=1 Tax=Methylomarinum vadi TaxID=438855 RepID=UPI0004DF6D61|nr:hypothetical protein [Methylomarinum vadi]
MGQSSSITPALFALGGVALAQGVAMFQSFLDRKNKHEVLLRTKYEELGAHFLESIKLPHALMKVVKDEEIHVLTLQASSNNALLLSLVYFPLLQQSLERYIESYSNLCLVSSSLFDPDKNKPLGAQVYDKPEYIAASDAHIEARDNLQEQIKIHASIYAKS